MMTTDCQRGLMSEVKLLTKLLIACDNIKKNMYIISRLFEAYSALQIIRRVSMGTGLFKY